MNSTPSPSIYSPALEDDFKRPRFWSTLAGIPLKGRDHLERARHLLIHRHSSHTGNRIISDKFLSDQIPAGGIDMGIPGSSNVKSEVVVAGPSSLPLIDLKGSHIESDDGSGSGSHRSLTPLPNNTNSYTFNQNMVSSSDTLRLMSSPQSLTTFISPEDSPALEERSSDGEYIHQEPTTIDDVDPILHDGVAVLAAKSGEETISTKRAIIASMTSSQQSWDILQGKRDEQVEEQVNALGLEMRKSQESGTASDISRTPSQSTTGTEKSVTGSFGTAASSLQSAPSSDTGLHEKELPLTPTTEAFESPKLYITACSSSDDLIQQRRIESGSLRRYHALLELVETETGYADDLSSLVNVFFQNLSTQAFFDESELRLKAVRRNASDLLELHSSLARKFSKIIEDCQISEASEGSDLEKAMRCEAAVIQVAQELTSAASRFDNYQLFCSRHAEALLLIREAEKRHGGDDFAAFERMCGNQIRGNSKVPRQMNTPSRRSSAGSSTPLGVGSISSTVAVEETLTTPGSGSTTPSSSFASISRRTSGRLLFADYLIKPIQRLCLYPLVLNSLHKYTPEDRAATRKTLESAIFAMRKIADHVDKASKQREVDLMSELLLIKLESHQGLSISFLKSLGNSSLSGTLDVLYHHDVLCPLAAPLRFHRMGLIIWNGFLLIVRVRKNQQLDCKYWLPLASADLTPLEETASPNTETASWSTSMTTSKPLVPFAMRLSFFGHYFELSASNDKERLIWHKSLNKAIQEAPSILETFPCSLPNHLNPIHYSASASLFNYFASNAKTMSNSADSLVRLSSASTRASVDRNMIFSEVLLSQNGYNGPTGNSGGGFGPVPWSQRDVGEAILTQQLRHNATPSIGSAVGAAMGLARMATPTAVKRSRRQSMLNLTEIKSTCDVLLSQSPGEFTPPSGSSSNTSPFLPSLSKRGSVASFKMKDSGSGNAASDNVESTSSNSKWRNSLMRRNSRAMSFRNQGGSPAPSPMTSTTDLSQSLMAEVPCSPGLIERSSTWINSAKPLHVRSKSNTLRDVWQNSIARRGRSQSTISHYTDTPSETEINTASSLSSSPVLDSKEEVNRNLIPSESTGSSSVAHLRRILTATSGQGSVALNRAKATSNRFLSSSFNDGSSSPLRIDRSGCGPIERSNTEVNFPSNYDSQARRKSEPNALNIERRNSASTITPTEKSQHPLRRLSRKMSLIGSGSSSPASNVVDLANSSTSTLWTDHNRLKSVEENYPEVIENAQNKEKQAKRESAKLFRPKLLRRRSSAET